MNKEPGRCKCGHKMHSMKPPHACWQHEVGTCSCTAYEGVDGKPYSDEYFRGGRRYDDPQCHGTIESNQRVGVSSATAPGLGRLR